MSGAAPTRRWLAASQCCSGCRNLVANCEASLRQPLFEQHKPVVTPERLAREQKERNAEHVVRGRLLLAAFVCLTPFPSEIFEIMLVRQSKIRNQPSHGFRLIGLEFAKKEFLEGHPAKLEQSAMRFGEEAANGGRGSVVNLQGPADPQTARFRPAPSIHVRVFDLVLGIDASLALAFESQLERNPSYSHMETFPERHAGIERQVGVRTLEVRVHFNFCFLARLIRHHLSPNCFSRCRSYRMRGRRAILDFL